MLVAVRNGRVQRVGAGKKEVDAEMSTRWLLVNLAIDERYLRLKGSPAPGDQPRDPYLSMPTSRSVIWPADLKTAT